MSTGDSTHPITAAATDIPSPAASPSASTGIEVDPSPEGTNEDKSSEPPLPLPSRSISRAAFLTTIDATGQPRFKMEKVRSEGRLRIFMTENEARRRRVVRSMSAGDESVTRLVIPHD